MHETLWSRNTYCSIADIWKIHEGKVVSTQPSAAEKGAAGLVRCGPGDLEELDEHIQKHICCESTDDVDTWRQSIGRIPIVIRVLYTPEEDSEPFGLDMVNTISPIFIGWSTIRRKMVSYGAENYGLAAVVKLRDSNVSDSTDALRLYFPDGEPIHPYIPAEDIVGKKNDTVELGWAMGTPPNKYMLFFTTWHEFRSSDFELEVLITEADVEAEELYSRAYTESSEGIFATDALERDASISGTVRQRILPGGMPGDSDAASIMTNTSGDQSLSSTEEDNEDNRQAGNKYRSGQQGGNHRTSSASQTAIEPPRGPRSWLAAGGEGNRGPQRSRQQQQQWQQQQRFQQPYEEPKCKSRKPKVGMDQVAPEDQGPTGLSI
ncbi:hypothetical protein PspLS_11226 [Pyricularia sp. CBS 133598]|nr:hypothetical protein PspLS_11226 [Pyricularia sp. CBS 133598]